LTPGAAVSWPARWWLLRWRSGRAVAARERCSDSSISTLTSMSRRASATAARTALAVAGVATAALVVLSQPGSVASCRQTRPGGCPRSPVALLLARPLDIRRQTTHSFAIGTGVARRGPVSFRPALEASSRLSATCGKQGRRASSLARALPCRARQVGRPVTRETCRDLKAGLAIFVSDANGRRYCSRKNRRSVESARLWSWPDPPKLAYPTA
jgi:hypothetical protein